MELVDSDGARAIIEAGGEVRRDGRYTGDYKYIVVRRGPVTEAEDIVDIEYLTEGGEVIHETQQ